MADTKLQMVRRPALEGIAQVGRFGAEKETPGITLSVLPGRSIVSVTARPGQAKSLSALFKKHFGCPLPGQGCLNYRDRIAMHWAGPGHWYIISEDQDLYDKIADRVSDLASLCDQSHGRITLIVSGQYARNVLAKGTPVDIHKSVFKPGNCALTEMAHIAVHFAETSTDDFEVSCYRSFAESLWDWLCEMSLEFGYEVR